MDSHQRRALIGSTTCIKSETDYYLSCAASDHHTKLTGRQCRQQISCVHNLQPLSTTCVSTQKRSRVCSINATLNFYLTNYTLNIRPQSKYPRTHKYSKMMGRIIEISTLYYKTLWILQEQTTECLTNATLNFRIANYLWSVQTTMKHSHKLHQIINSPRKCINDHKLKTIHDTHTSLQTDTNLDG